MTMPPQNPAGYGAIDPEPARPRPRVGRAFGWAFTTTFKNAKIWVVFGLVAGALSGVLNYASDASFDTLDISAGLTQAELQQLSAQAGVSALITVVISLLVAPLVVTAALRQVDEAKLGWGQALSSPNYGPTLGVQVLSGLASAVVTLAIGVVAVLLLGLFGAGGGVVLIIGAPVVLLALFFAYFAVSAFFCYWQFFAADRRAAFGQAISRGFKLGKTAFWPTVGLLALIVLYGLGVGIAAGIVAVLFAALGAFLGSVLSSALVTMLLLPVTVLAFAHLFRQGVGGQLPAGHSEPIAY